MRRTLLSLAAASAAGALAAALLLSYSAGHPGTLSAMVALHVANASVAAGVVAFALHALARQFAEMKEAIMECGRAIDRKIDELNKHGANIEQAVELGQQMERRNPQVRRIDEPRT